MKLLWVFWMYLLCLAVLPCHDGVECPELRTEKADGHGKHESENEQCPPFCNCACCGVQVVQTVPMTFEPEHYVLPVASSEITFYRQRFPDDPAKSIWQPPRLG